MKWNRIATGLIILSLGVGTPANMVLSVQASTRSVRVQKSKLVAFRNYRRSRNHFTQRSTHSYQNTHYQHNQYQYRRHQRSWWSTVVSFLFGWLLGSRRSAITSQGNRSNSYSDAKSNTCTTANATPSQKLATTVLSSQVKQQLGKNISYNGAGAFIINHNHATVNVQVSSAPYATNKLDRQGRAADGEALLNKTTRQYQSRTSTNNGSFDWKPAGFIQRTGLSGKYQHAYDRGHLLGYALIGNVRGFDASEHNADNIATQTAWANEADTKQSTGQNYYESIVRQALDQQKTVRYSVKDLYADKLAKVPAGAWIQAKSKDSSVNFNVFVPNVQAGLTINYQTGVTVIKND